jgi:sterol desaturase/sphingolipid hydroxylase (fatty acid hydroxylase superfamily)
LTSRAAGTEDVSHGVDKKGDEMSWFAAMVWLALYAPIAEYVVHRWVMHLPRLGRGSWWREHAVEHHRNGRNDINIEISALAVLLASSPMFLLAVPLGWPWVVLLLVACILYAAFWSSLHAAHHGVSKGWTTCLTIFSAWQKHHMRHHARPDRNFGTVFIFTDALFGTYDVQPLVSPGKSAAQG